MWYKGRYLECNEELCKFGKIVIDYLLRSMILLAPASC